MSVDPVKPLAGPQVSRPPESRWQRTLRAVSGVYAWDLIADFKLTRIPTVWVFVLTIIDSALTVLNQATFDLPSAWKTAVTILLGAIGYLGIGPVLGAKFRTFVHLPARLAGAIGLVLLVLMVVVQQDTALPWRAIILGVIQFFGCLGFAPAYVPTA